MRRVSRTGLVAFGLLCTSALSGAGQPPRATGRPGPPSLDELVAVSRTIVAGEVIDMRSAWNAARTDIQTTVSLRVEQRFRGAGGDVVRFRIPGGTVGDIEARVTHAPAFFVGERALVFLRGESGRLARVVFGEAGKRHLRRAADGEDHILPALALPAGASGSGPISTLGEFRLAVPAFSAASPR